MNIWRKEICICFWKFPSGKVFTSLIIALKYYFYFLFLLEQKKNQFKRTWQCIKAFQEISYYIVLLQFKASAFSFYSLQDGKAKRRKKIKLSDEWS